MRGISLTLGTVIGGGFLLLGFLVLVMGEGSVPAQGGDVQVFGMPAYAMGIAWLGLGASVFCIGLLAAEVGPKYHVGKVRDAAFLVFGGGLVTALLLVIMRAYANVAL
jgi:hypothetical protein